MAAAPEASSGTALWSTEVWRMTATTWLDDRLGEVGISRTGEIEQPHLRPWATALRAPTTAGPVWLKATAPGTAAEVGLYALLSEVVPERVLSPIAIDLERSWMLLPDGGPKLGEDLEHVDLAEAMAVVLPVYAQLQLDLAPHVDGMLELGLTDMRPTILVDRFDEALAAAQTHGSQDEQTLRRLHAAAPMVRDWSAELADLPGPHSVDHNDLHPWNVLVPGPDRLAEARFFDWGDAVVSHAFASMLVPLAMIHEHVGGDRLDSRLIAARDAYLDCFDDLAPRSVLLRTLDVACRLGKIARALTWARAIALLSDEEASKYAASPYESLVRILDESYIGAT